MLAREERKKEKGTGVFISLTIHAILIALLLLAITEKRLTDDFFARHHQEQKAAPVRSVTDEEKNHPKQQPAPEKHAAKKSLQEEKKPTLNQPFVVPAPVVFYGNQAMMNKPVPISGHKDGKSAFEHSPSTLPTPPAQAIAPEPTQSINAPQQLVPHKNQAASSPEPLEEIQTYKTSEKEDVFTKQEQNSKNSALQPGTGAVLLDPEKVSPFAKTLEDRQTTKDLQQKKQASSEQTQQAKKLTLADLFKNATTTIAAFAQDGLPSARKAGTEGGDDQGSGHQITIKEGDMKYYTLWAKFLNHLNQSARFSRRGKEALIHNWIQNKEIQYILQCGITVDMQGKVLDIEITVSSGCPGFDKLCIADIKAAVPYPPLPESLGKKTARFEVNVYP